MKINLRTNKLTHLYIILLFIVMSIFSSILLLKANFVGYGWDMYFHLSRIWDIRDSILSGNGFPLVSLNKFHQSGSAALSLYPYINLIPIVLLSFIVKSFVHLIYIVFILRNLLSMIIAFYSSYYFNKDKSISFIFASVYTLSTMVLWYAFYGMDMGVTSSLIFLPLVMFGTLHLLKENKWKELSIGVSIISLCHIITAVLSVIFVGSLIAMNYRKIKEKSFIFSLIKAAVFVLIITSFFWVQFLLLMVENHISMPAAMFNLYGEDFTNLIDSVFSNQITEFISLPAFVGIVVSAVSYKNMEKINKQLFIISILVILIASQFFPWSLLNGTFIRTTFQRSWRVYPFAQLILCYLFSYGVVKLCHSKKRKIIVTISVIFATLCVQLVSQKNVINYFNHKNYDVSHIENDNGLLFSDYWQKSFTSDASMYQLVNNRQAISSKGEKVSLRLRGNGTYTFKLKNNIKELNMPFMIYKSIKYKVKIDNNFAKLTFNSKNQLVIKNLNKGKHKVTVSVQKSWYNYLSFAISILGIILIIFGGIKSLMLKRKNMYK